MKKFNSFSIGLIFAAFTIVGCENMLDVDSDRFIYAEDHKIDSPNDTIFTMVGILSQVQKLADRYVILGELRGDLMEVTENSNLNLHQINNFEVSVDNPYVNIKDYYAVINNCNFLIHNIDTSKIAKGEKAYYKEFAAAKAIRAWTYMQLVMNFGKAKYYENPILTVQDANKAYPEVDMLQLADLLIADLEPFKSVPIPGEVDLGDIKNVKSFFPIRFLLGDLFMWRKEYDKAAQEYRDLMFENEYLITDTYQSYWETSGAAFTVKQLRWNRIFTTIPNEDQITSLNYSTEYGQGANLDSLAYSTYEIAPSKIATQNWDNQMYYHDNVHSIEGDLRGDEASYYSTDYIISYMGSASIFTGPVAIKTFMYTTDISKIVPIYRASTLYLRYAEAVNRLNKPNLAFATLKNGLNIVTIATPSIVPRSEVGDVRPSYMNFDNQKFLDNIGVHARGCGFTEKANAYKIPSLATMDDSVKYVEDLIVNEYALECAFEGNRFQDLMRVALRRGEPAYLADKVAAKHKDNSEAIRAKLMDTSNWYLPTK